MVCAGFESRPGNSLLLWLFSLSLSLNENSKFITICQSTLRERFKYTEILLAKWVRRHKVAMGRRFCTSQNCSEMWRKFFSVLHTKYRKFFTEAEFNSFCTYKHATSERRKFICQYTRWIQNRIKPYKTFYRLVRTTSNSKRQNKRNYRCMTVPANRDCCP
jgi:hypothetical protein